MQHPFKKISDQSFNFSHNIMAAAEGHLNVYLGKFRLTISPKVFITETTCDLKIPFYSRNHQKLLKQLRGLGQGEKITRGSPAGHQKVTGAFRCTASQHRRFNFPETMFIKVLPGGHHDFVPHFQSALHFKTPQIQITVF